MSSRSIARPLAAALAAFLLSTSTLAAQDAPRRDGFFIGFGLGGGGGELSGDVDAEGGVGYLTLGGTLSQKVRLAGDFTAFVPEEDEDASYGTSTVAVLFYPSARGNFFMKGGVGASTVSFKGPGPDGTGVGFGAIWGAGYDFRIGKNFSITPQLSFFGGQTGDVEDEDGNVIANDVHFGFGALTVGVTFH